MTQLGPYGEADIKKITTTLLDTLKDSSCNVWCFNGEMGAGKTTTIANLLHHAGVEDRVSSPTFSIVNEYFSPDMGTIYHFDFYRIEMEEEAIDIGTIEYFDSDNLCLLEWSSKIPNLLPDSYGIISITVHENNERTLTISKHE